MSYFDIYNRETTAKKNEEKELKDLPGDGTPDYWVRIRRCVR